MAQRKVELLEAKEQEHSFTRRDLAVLKELERAKEQVAGSSAPGTNPPIVEPSLSRPSADLGGLQADFYDPSFDYSFLFEGLPLASPGASGGILVPVTCSSLGFLQVPKCYGFRAIFAT